METNCNNEVQSIGNIILESGITVPDEQSVEIPESDYIKDKEDSAIKEMNDFFEKRYIIYKDILAPELRKNEELKRIHKSNLMNNIFKLLKFQFIATYILIVIFVLMIAFNRVCNITEDVITQIFDFLKFYITSIVAELIAILFFIVKNVFDKSIVELFKNFDKSDEAEAQEK